MEYLADCKDKQFDLAIVDPPYGIGDFVSSKSKHIHGDIKWNEATPEASYFNELQRTSNNRIVWGVNYYVGLVKEPGRIIHYKLGKRHKTSPTLSDADIASHSFNNLIKTFVYTWKGNVQGDTINWNNEGADARIHPCQKPVALYRWLLQNYAKPGDTILDTHGGSMSIAIACYIEGFDLVCIEKDKDYFEAAKKRYEDYVAMNPKMFEPEELRQPQQTELF